MMSLVALSERFNATLASGILLGNTDFAALDGVIDPDTTEVTHTFEVTVANTNQAPKILPLPLQLVNEGDTVSFTVLAADPDGTPLNLGLMHDATTPAGVSFVPQGENGSGYFEWTPGQDSVDQRTEDGGQKTDQAYTFTFSASDGIATTIRTVQVRVFDVNRAPQLQASNHAVVVGQSLSLPVQLSGYANANPTYAGIVATDPDGATQTAALTISFTGLPEGASYDAQNPHPNPPPEGEGTNVAQGAAQTLGCLNWTPGPGQIGDYTVTVQAFDGKNTSSQSFVLRVTADATANAPKVLVSTTPSTPALPGQTVVATVRASGYSAIQTLAVQVRGTGTDPNAWQTVALDSMCRLYLSPTQPGLLDIQVTAINQDCG